MSIVKTKGMHRSTYYRLLDAAFRYEYAGMSTVLAQITKRGIFENLLQEYSINLD